MFVSAEQDNNESNDTQNSSKSNIAGYVGRSWYQTNQVVDKNKEENGQQEGNILFVAVTQVGFSLHHLLQK